MNAKNDIKIPQTLQWLGDTDGYLEIIDQRQLPTQLVKIPCRTIEQLCDAIKTLAVRGAPAIGVAAAFGICLGIQRPFANISDAFSAINQSADRLIATRPTAVNIFWAAERMKTSAANFIAQNPAAPLENLREAVLAEAKAIYNEDIEMCLRIGKNGEKFITDGCIVLTHCNAGALATAGQGTALSVIYEAKKTGKKFKVYVDETRPLLQGARLTAWELTQAGIDTTLICDNMAGWLIKQGKIDLIITGADRIAANGDTANKIGTFSLSVLAEKFNKPFYIAAPSSTFDLSIQTGRQITIEQRPDSEVKTIAGTTIASEPVKVYNPAFDITDAENITAIITDKGVIEKPDARKIASHFANNSGRR